MAKIKKDPKAYYGYAKRFSETNSDIGPFFNKDGNLVLDAEVIADILKSSSPSISQKHNLTIFPLTEKTLLTKCILFLQRQLLGNPCNSSEKV